MRNYGTILIIFAGLFLTGCSAVQPGMTTMAIAPLGYSNGKIGGLPEIADTDVKSDIPVFLVSGRNLLDSPKGVNPFGNKRGKEPTPHLAIATVGVGEGLSREEIIKETLSSDPGSRKTRFALKKIDVMPPLSVDHFALDHTHENYSAHPWVEALKKRMDQGKSRMITIYVHGYNTELIQNTEFTAQMDHFGGRDGAVVSFEWPSVGLFRAYAADKGNATYSTRVFRGVIANIARETNANKVNIVAHSAGTPIVVNALRELRLINKDLDSNQLHQKFRISKVALAAADMDLMSFFNGVFDQFHEVADGVAVYASTRDKALDLSRKLYRAERLGKAVEGLKPWEKELIANFGEIEMIDVKVPESRSFGIIGHSYYHSNPWVSSDIVSFVHGASPEGRLLVRDQGGIYWTFPTNYPELISNL